jgi:ribosome-associated protein
MPDVMNQIRPEEVDITAVRAQGAGGQNVNKVSSAVHLRFDIRASSLAEELKQRLISHPDRRITSGGVIIIKAQRYRTLEKNRDDALVRLQEIVDKAATPRLPRKRTRPTKSSRRRRVDEKVLRGKTKATRRRPDPD